MGLGSTVTAVAFVLFLSPDPQQADGMTHVDRAGPIRLDAESPLARDTIRCSDVKGRAQSHSMRLGTKGMGFLEEEPA